MTKPMIIQSLKDKRAEIHHRIAAYQAQIAQAKHDLARIMRRSGYLPTLNTSALAT